MHARPARWSYPNRLDAAPPIPSSPNRRLLHWPGGNQPCGTVITNERTLVRNKAKGEIQPNRDILIRRDFDYSTATEASVLCPRWRHVGSFTIHRSTPSM